MDIWIVMVEQHYANLIEVVMVCDNEQYANEVAAKGPDRKVYKSELNTTYPCI